MPVTVACPACGARMNAPDNLAGKKVKCPKCQSPVVVPSAEDEGFEVVEKPPPKAPAKPAPTRARVADDDDEDDDRPRKKKPARDDDEDEDDEPVKAKPRKKAARDDDEEDEDDEDDRPRKKKKKAKGGIPVWVWPAAAAAVLGIGAGVYFGVIHKSGDGKAADGKAGDAKAGDAKPGGKPAAPVWGKLDGPDGDFVAEFPGGPPGAGDLAALVSAQGGNPAMAADMEKTMAAAGINLRIWTRQDGGRTYILQLMTFPQIAAQELAGPNGLNTVVTSIRQSATQQPGTVVVSETDSTLGGRPGKILVVRNATVGKGGVFNVTLSGVKMYTLAVTGDAALSADDQMVKQFFEKFVLKGK